jgi:hypothetical protein
MFNPFILALLIISISWRLRAVESRMISMPQSPQPSADADRFDNWRHLDINETSARCAAANALCEKIESLRHPNMTEADMRELRAAHLELSLLVGG